MAHLVESMFSVKETPWHGLGEIIQEAPSIEEGIKLAGLDWDVSLRPMKTADEDGLEVPGYKVVMREDNKKPLGVVTNSYTPVQNTEAFKFFEPFLEAGQAKLETAGSLQEGKRIFVLAKLSLENMEIDKDDVVKKYILLSNSHNGSEAVKVGFTPIRVVCANTLYVAENNSQSSLIRVTHKGNVIASLEDIRETMDAINQQFIATEDQYKRLAQNKNIKEGDIAKYVNMVMSNRSLKDLIDIVKRHEIDSFQERLIEKEEISKARERLIARTEEVFATEKVHNTWTMYNSLNHYFNHERGRSENTRYNSLWFGTSRQYDKRALELARVWGV